MAGAQKTAQEPSSVGVAHPDSTQPIRAYRLPTWHWSRWTLQARGGVRRESGHRDSLGVSDVEANQFGADLLLAPRYQGFWESEARQASLRLSPSLSLRRSDVTSSGPNRDSERADFDISARLSIEGSLREYVIAPMFVFASASGEADYDYSHTVEDSRESIRSVLDGRGTGRVGIGVGRVRVVTPVIRALRMRERLRTVVPSRTVSDDQVQTAARQLARRPGYQAIYDRPDKYFWRTFFEAAGLSSQSPFETFYVADVLREPVGVRREGAELVAGALGSHEGGEDTRRGRGGVGDEQIYGDALGGFARGRWYRNLSLRHQLGVDVASSYVNYVTEPDNLDGQIQLNAEGQWLWVLADRLKLDTRIRADLLYRHNLYGRGRLRPLNRYVFSSDLLVFAENRFSIRIGAHVRYSYDAAVREGVRRSHLQSGLQFNVEYVLSRALR